MDINELKEQIKNNVKVESANPARLGGQQCGIISSKQRLYSEELDLSIEIGYHRSQFANRELALTLFSLALDELVK